MAANAGQAALDAYIRSHPILVGQPVPTSLAAAKTEVAALQAAQAEAAALKAYIAGHPDVFPHGTIAAGFGPQPTTLAQATAEVAAWHAARGVPPVTATPPTTGGTTPTGSGSTPTNPANNPIIVTPVQAALNAYIASHPILVGQPTPATMADAVAEVAALQKAQANAKALANLIGSHPEVFPGGNILPGLGQPQPTNLAQASADIALYHSSKGNPVVQPSGSTSGLTPAQIAAAARAAAAATAAANKAAAAQAAAAAKAAAAAAKAAAAQAAKATKNQTIIVNDIHGFTSNLVSMVAKDGNAILKQTVQAQILAKETAYGNTLRSLGATDAQIAQAQPSLTSLSPILAAAVAAQAASTGNPASGAAGLTQLNATSTTIGATTTTDTSTDTTDATTTPDTTTATVAAATPAAPAASGNLVLYLTIAGVVIAAYSLWKE